MELTDLLNLAVLLVGVFCLLCFLLVIPRLFTHATDGNNLSWKQRFWIIVNLLVWAYECFFLVAVCGGIKGMAVYFGGGLGDLLYIFLLAGMVLLHIILLAVFTYKHLRIIFFIILVCPPINLLIMMHSDAARGNEENGYMTGGNWTGLYYDQEAYWQRKKLKEAAKPENSGTDAAFELWLHEAEQGDVWAQYEVAVCYTLGNGVEQNDSLAIKWFGKAAEGGDVQCQVSMGVFYYNGSHGLDIDHREALKWFLKAAKQGDAYAQYFTGRCYHLGEGADQNDEEAFKWLRLSARQGYKQAQELLQENKQTW